MASPNNPAPAVVEPQPEGDEPAVTMRALQLRIRQQQILSELGVSALHGASLDRLLDDTARLTAEGLRTEFCKVLEFLPDENIFLVRAGVGWRPDVVGIAKVGADLASPAGFALRTGKPVISNHLENEQRFKTPDLLAQHDIHRAMNVILQGDGRPFGVLEVDSRSEEKFVEQDLSFLQGAANILGMAIERERHERSLKAALRRQGFLLKEMNHRVKNSLSIVAGMLRLQAREIDDENFTAHFDEASHRIEAIARAHDQLYRHSEVEQMDVGRYVEAVCKDLDVSIGQCEILVEARHGFDISTDRAISSALIVNELIANAVKYAYRDRAAGRIWVSVASAGAGNFSISVRDEGEGLPPGFQPGKAKGLGMRIVKALAEQIEGVLTLRQHDPGTEFIVTAPLETPLSGQAQGTP